MNHDTTLTASHNQPAMPDVAASRAAATRRSASCLLRRIIPATILSFVFPLATSAQIPPLITSPLVATGTVDAPFSYAITANGDPAPTLSVIGLGAGLAFTSPNITGAPTELQITATLQAVNTSGTDLRTLIITNTTYRPVFTSTLQVTATEGFPFSYTMEAAGDQPITYTFDQAAYAERETGIFRSYEIVSGTVVDFLTIKQEADGAPIITGTSMWEGTDTLALIATNDRGTHQVSLNITGTSLRPVFTSANWTNVPVGQPFTFQLEATESPTRFDAYGTLPSLLSGLDINQSTGLLSGMMTDEGATELFVAAENQHGSRTARFKVAGYLPAPSGALLWTGAAEATGTATWDSTAQNWSKGGAARTFADGEDVYFDDSSTTDFIFITGSHVPRSIIAKNSGRSLTLRASGDANTITGTAPLIMQGSGTLYIGGTARNDANNGTRNWSGIIRLESGVVVREHQPISGPVVFAGGTLTLTFADSAYSIGNLMSIPEGVFGVLNLPNRPQFRSVLAGSGTLKINITSRNERVYFGLPKDPTTGDNVFFGEMWLSGTGGVGNPENATLGAWDVMRYATLRVDCETPEGHFHTQAQTNSGGNTQYFGALSGTSHNVSMMGPSNTAGTLTLRIGDKNIDSSFAGTIGDFRDPGAPGNWKTNVRVQKYGTGMLTFTGSHNYRMGTSVAEGALRLAPSAKLLGPLDVNVSSLAAFGGSGQVRPNVNFAENSTLLVDADPDTGELAGLTVNGLVSFAGETLKVRPVVPGSPITNGVYTILFSDPAFGGNPELVWDYPDNPGVQATFSYIKPNEIEATITGGAIPKPKITSGLGAEVMAGQPFTYTFTAVGDTTVATTLEVSNLPDGLSFDAPTGIISGTVAASEYYPFDHLITLAARNPAGTTSATLTLRVYDTLPLPPVITSLLRFGVTVGRPTAYQIEADNFPTRFSAEGLPRGLSIDANGLITGKSDVLGTYPVTITASNLAGTDTKELILIVALPPPTVTVVNNAVAVQHEPFTHQINADNSPTGYGMSAFVEVANNVSGTIPITYLTVDETTGIISGACPNVETTGTVALRITGTVFAWNPTGTGWAPLAITVNPQRPVILDGGQYTGIAGVPFTHTIAATNMYPAYSRNYGVTNMPRGLNITPKTGQITGSPLVSGVFESAFVASNVTSSGAKLVTFVINGASVLGTLAGKAGFAGSDDGPAPDARFNAPGAAVSDKDGNLYIADTGNNAIRKIAPDGAVSTLTTTAGKAASIVIDATGTILYVADSAGNAIIKTDTATGATTALALTGAPALNSPHGLALDASGNLYVADTGNHLIRKITLATGAMTVIAGNARGNADGTGSAAGFDTPMGLAITPDGATLYVADTGNSTIRSIATATGVVETLAGSAGLAGGTDATGSAARFNTPGGLALDASGVLYVADTGNHCIRSVDTTTGKVVTFAGTSGAAGSTDGNVTQSTMNMPGGVAIDAEGQIYVIDTDNHTVRMLQVGPDIVTPPANQSAPRDTTAAFTVVASGAPLPIYQWYKDDMLIPGATESTLTVDAVKLTDVAIYKVVVDNPLGTRTATAYLSLADAHPSNPPDVGVGNSGGSGAGGGGAPSPWFLGALAALLGFRRLRRFRSSVLLASVLCLLPSDFSPPAFSQSIRSGSGIVTGRVLNKATGQYLSDAVVTVEGTNIETLTDSTGSFRLMNVPSGAVRVSASYTGLDRLTREVVVSEGSRVNADFDLTAQIYQMEAFVVSGAREGSARAIQEQRVSVSQKAIFAADSFGNIVDNNIGELMKNLPGITIDYDGEDAATMRIRGMDPEFAAITLDGNEVATVGVYEGELGALGGDQDDSRAFNLRTAALQNIESIELKIAPTPEDPGNAMGGLVDIKTKSALSQKGRRLYFAANLSLNTAELDFDKTPGGARTPNRKIQPGFNFGWTESFGSRQRIGFAFDVGFTRTYRYSNGYTLPGGYTYDTAILAANNNKVLPDTPGFVNSLRWTESGKSEEKRMISLNLDYQPWGPNHSFFLKSSYNDARGLGSYSRSMTLTAGTRADGSNLNTILSPIGARVDITNGTTEADNKNYSFNAGAVHKFGRLEIDYNAHFSHADNKPDPEQNYSIGYNSTGYGFNVFNIAGNAVADIVQTAHDGAGVIDAGDPRSYRNLDNYNSLAYRHNFTYGTDERRGAKFNIRIPLVLRVPFTSYEIPVDIKTGASYGEQQRHTHRYQRNRRLTGGSTLPNWLTSAEPELRQFADRYFMDSWGFDVPIPAWVSPYKIQDYFNSHPNSFYDTTSSEWEGNLYNELRNEKWTKESTTAAYLMLTIRPHRTLAIVTGFRYERMDNSGSGYSYEGYQSAGGYNKYEAGEKYDSVTSQLPVFDLSDPNNPIISYIPNPRLNWTQEEKIRNLFTKVDYSNPASTKMLPNLQIKWTPHKDWNIRFARSESVGRPKFGNVLFQETWRESSRTIERTNPGLKPSSSEKYDVAIEYYPGKDGMITLSLFHQKFKDIIYDNTTFLTVIHDEAEANGPDTIFDDTHPDGLWAVITPDNIGKGQNQGFEITYRQKLGFIHQSLAGFELYGAYSYANPETEYQRHTMPRPSVINQDTMLEYLMSQMIWETIPMQKIQKRSATLQLRYNSRQFSGKIAAYWVDEFALGINREYVEITNQNASIRLDFSLSYKISSRWTASLDWRNMTNVGDDRKIFDRTGGYFTSGMVMNLGVRANF
jgi:TonB-dependent receptor